MKQGYELELLAPAGNWEVLTSVVEAGADAVYAGGKRFNMRGLRPDWNFSDQEIKAAVDYLHNKGRKLYITINNLYFDHELEELKDYILFLAGAGVDALIIQDMAAARICRELDLDIPLHASVQMGVANLQAVKYLGKIGFDRVILSKNISLEEIKNIKQGSSLGIEFFAHGDLCISHTGQCYMSSYLAVEGGNRGRCIKPCRWEYGLNSSQGTEMRGYLLAHNDLCLYPYLQDLVSAGVISFKIEGRMRSSEYLSHLIKIYRRALDKIIEDSYEYSTDEDDMKFLQEKRIRDLCPGNLFGRTTIDMIGISGEREPFFISESYELKKQSQEDYRPRFKTEGSIESISIKAGSMEAVEALYNTGVDNIILGCEQMRQDGSGWNIRKINKAVEAAASSDVKLLLESPRILSNQDVLDFQHMLRSLDKKGIYAVIANDLGAVKLAKDNDYRVWGGYGLNVSNSSSCMLYCREGLERITASQELTFTHLKNMTGCEAELELTVQGPLCGMITDYCTIRAAYDKNQQQKECSIYCSRDDHTLQDKLGQLYQIRTDMQCRNYIYSPYQICLLPYLPVLSSAGLKHIRIDGQYYDIDTLLEVTAIYSEAVRELNLGKWHQQEDYYRLLDIFPEGLTGVPVFA